MHQNFLDSFNDLIRERVFDVNDTIVKDDREYTELLEESEKVFKDIQKFVPEQSKEILSHYEDLTGVLNMVSNDLMYKQGFKEGIKLFCFLIAKALNDGSGT